jgi:hypothetical protein
MRRYIDVNMSVPRTILRNRIFSLNWIDVCRSEQSKQAGANAHVGGAVEGDGDL